MTTAIIIKMRIGTISVGGGDYGYSVNKSAERELLAQQLEDCETVTREPEYFTREFGPENDGLSDSYIEVDISRQHVWIYRDGSCVLDTDCVTGMLSGTRATPTGIYQILYKATDVDLKGQQLADGKYSYVSHVNYWMPFYNSCGFHDASWRSNFGGSIYINNGSHGCVNLPSWVAADFYSCVEEGMPVIIYYS